MIEHLGVSPSAQVIPFTIIDGKYVSRNYALAEMILEYCRVLFSIQTIIAILICMIIFYFRDDIKSILERAETVEISGAKFQLAKGRSNEKEEDKENFKEKIPQKKGE